VEPGFRGVDAANPGVQIIHRGKFKSLRSAAPLARAQAGGKARHRALEARQRHVNIRWLLRAVLRPGLKSLSRLSVPR
jgi:IS5 family transposase